MHGTLLHTAAGRAGILLEHMRVGHEPVLRRHVRQQQVSRTGHQSTPDQASAEEPLARDEAKIGLKAEAKPKKKKK